MALRVWLPLNGNLNNQGLSPAIIEAVTTPVYTDGKIGKCLSEGKIKIPAEYVGDIFNNEHMSICFWYNNNTDSTSGNHAICGFSGNGEGDSGATRIWDFFNYSTPNIFHWSMGTLGNGTLEAFPANTWVHMAITFDGSNLLIYKNGELAVTQTGKTSAYTFDKSYYISFGKTPQKLNDFRIYDECLSQKQIKEISKGLVAHYKLDTPWSINNLKRNISYGVYNNYSSSGSTCTVVATGEYYNGSKVYRMTYTPNETSLSNVQTSLYSHGVTTSGQSFTAGTKYCYWTLFKPISHMDVVVGGTASNIGYWYEIPMQEYGGGWYIVGQKRTGNAPETKSDTIYTSFKCPSATAGTPIIIDFCCPHLVEGYDYILDEFDYQGNNPNYVEDCSGNGYKAPKSGTLILNDNSPRYSKCTKFDSGYLHQMSSPLNVNSDAFTISCWFYPTQNATMCLINDRKAVGDGLAVFYLGSGIRFDTGSSYQWQVGSITVNAWNHVVVTWDKNAGNKKLYLNGNLINTTTSYGTLAQIGDVFSIGNSSTNGAAGAGNQVYGSISDFRIYATALSADDILTMYKNSGIIDNKGNVYAYEFKEE